MSLATVLQRVEVIQGLLHGSAAHPAAPAATTAAMAAASFAGVLAAQTAPESEAAADNVPYAAEIASAAARHGVDPALVRAVIRQESGFDPRATSSAGAQGLMQLMPATARSLGVVDPYDPLQSIEGGTRYLRSMLDRFGGDASLTLAAYNAGPTAVARYGGIPPYRETETYVERVLDGYRKARVERSVP